jgi:hypothetical protein
VRIWIGLAACAALAAGCGSGKQAATTVPKTTAAGGPPASAFFAPAPSDPMRRARLAGLTPEPAEQLAYHVHAHLDLFVNGQQLLVPAAIGIDITDPAVREFAEPDGSIGYGGINPPCADACISPLHTHSDDGILHTESPITKLNGLGEFFTEWNVRLTPRCVGRYCKPKTRVAIYVDGKPYHGDPRRIPLSDLKEIAILIAKPPTAIPSHFPTG